MSNLIYGPDGKPLPNQPEENPYQTSPSEQPSGNYPRERSPLDLIAFGCGLCSFFMMGSSNYFGIALMFGSGLAAIIFAITSKRQNHYRSKLGTVGLIIGWIGFLFSLMTIFSLVFFLSHQEEMKAAMDTYMQMYEQLTGQPFPQDALNGLYQQ